MSDAPTPEKALLPAAVPPSGRGSKTGQGEGRELWRRPPEVDSVGPGLACGRDLTGGDAERGRGGSTGAPPEPRSSQWAESSLCFNGGGVFLLYECRGLVCLRRGGASLWRAGSDNGRSGGGALSPKGRTGGTAPPTGFDLASGDWRPSERRGFGDASSSRSFKMAANRHRSDGSGRSNRSGRSDGSGRSGDAAAPSQSTGWSSLSTSTSLSSLSSTLIGLETLDLGSASDRSEPRSRMSTGSSPIWASKAPPTPAECASGRSEKSMVRWLKGLLELLGVRSGTGSGLSLSRVMMTGGLRGRAQCGSKVTWIQRLTPPPNGEGCFWSSVEPTCSVPPAAAVSCGVSCRAAAPLT